MNSNEYITLGEIYKRCNDWELFCSEENCPINLMEYEEAADLELLFSERKWRRYGFYNAAHRQVPLVTNPH